MGVIYLNISNFYYDGMELLIATESEIA